MDQINLDIHNAIHGDDIDMLHFILENIIRNNNIEAFIDLIIDITYENVYNYNNDDLFEFFVYAINSINLNQKLTFVHLPYLIIQLHHIIYNGYLIKLLEDGEMILNFSDHI